MSQAPAKAFEHLRQNRLFEGIGSKVLESAWSSSSNASREQVKLYVGYLRRKLREAAEVEPLETVRGFGYRYNPGRP